MTELARVYHNIETDTQDRPLGMLDGYCFGHSVTRVADIEIGGRLGLEPRVFNWAGHLAWIWDLLNVGETPEYGSDPQAVAYRKRRNRSLSTGDVIEMRGMYWAVAKTGFRLLEEAPVIVTKTVYGSTNLGMYDARSDALGWSK